MTILIKTLFIKMKILKYLFFFMLSWYSITSEPAGAQQYFNGKFRKAGFTTNSYHYKVYDFIKDGSTIKTKYFAQNAYQQYENWKSGKTVLLVTAGAFSDSWSSTAKPVGLCVDNGTIVNRIPDQVMDAMVIVYKFGGLFVADMDMKNITIKTDTGNVSLDPRSSSADRYKFLNWSEKNAITLFQTQLVYSWDRTTNFTNLTFGPKKERRFLATCKKGDVVHNIVIDAPDKLELNLSASYCKNVLEYDGFTVMHILNLDTGCKNILYVYDGSSLVNMAQVSSGCESDAKIEKATSLLIYYTE